MKPILLVQPGKLLRAVYPRALWHMPREEKRIYLTFDDGPVPGITEWVLDTLAGFGAKATFFCVGENVVKNPSIYQRIKLDGHSVGNHTMRHVKGFVTGTEEYLEDVKACHELVGSNLFRPPYGKIKQAQYRKVLANGLKMVMWDVISYDYEKIDPESCRKNVIQHTRNGSIVLFHDSMKAEANMKHALIATLEHFGKNGFSFEKL